MSKHTTPVFRSTQTPHVCVRNTCMHSRSHMLVLFVLQEATALGAMPSRLTLRQIADAMFRPPNIRNGGPTEIDILPVLPDTDTKSYEDYHRTAAHLDDHCAASVKVKLDWTDGQGCITGALPTLCFRFCTIGLMHLEWFTHANTCAQARMGRSNSRSFMQTAWFACPVSMSMPTQHSPSTKCTSRNISRGAIIRSGELHLPTIYQNAHY